jgi:hypothetical protein
MRRLLISAMALGLSLGVAGASGRPQPKPGQIVSIRDTTRFDPDGNYIPVDSITVGGYRLDSFSLGVLEYSFGFQSDSATYAPSGILELTTADTTEGGGVADFVRFSPDTLELVFPGTEIGTVRISGSFLDKRGRFDRPEIEPGKTPVLRARVTVTSGGRTVYSRRMNFTYMEGD